VLELVGSETIGVDGLVPIPAHIEHAFATRVEHLPETPQDALLVAAVDDLGLLDVLDRATLLEALGAAEDAGLVNIAQARLEFRHPVVRSAITSAPLRPNAVPHTRRLHARSPPIRRRGGCGTRPRRSSRQTPAPRMRSRRSRPRLSTGMGPRPPPRRGCVRRS
jgi:hypothetical protein